MVALEALLDKLSDGICITTAEGSALYMNPAARTMLEIADREVQGKSVCETLCGRLLAAGPLDCRSSCPLRKPAPVQRAVAFVGCHGPKTTFEWSAEGVRRSEEWRDLRVHCMRLASTLFDHRRTEKHFVVIEDVSAEGELQRHKEDWRSMIAHDLRTPLSVVFAALRAFGESEAAQALNAKERSLLEIGTRNCLKMTELLDLYLEIARFDAGAMPLKTEEVALKGAALKCLKEMEPLAAQKKIALSEDAPASLTIRADAALLERVLQNLVGNAIKFTPEGGAVSVGAQPEGRGRVRVWVKDNGCGVSPEEIPYIFDRFHHAAARREGRIQGNGLGLTFCREALKAMGGTIEVVSAPGRGSEFRFHLPDAAQASKKEALCSPGRS